MKSLVLGKNILESNFRRSRFPYKLTFVATYRCQSRCVYCKIWEKEPEGELTLENIQAFFKKSNRFFETHKLAIFSTVQSGRTNLVPHIFEDFSVLLNRAF